MLIPIIVEIIQRLEFETVVIGILMDKYNLGVVMGFLSALYLLSFVVMITLPGLKTLTKEAKRN